MGEDRTLGPLGKYLGGVGRRRSPYGQKEEKEKFAQGRVQQGQWDMRKPKGVNQYGPKHHTINLLT